MDREGKTISKSFKKSFYKGKIRGIVNYREVFLRVHRRENDEVTI